VPILENLFCQKMKQFLGKNEALSLAGAIIDVQEKKTQLKMDKNHRLQAAQPQQIAKTVSRTKSRLKEAKDILVARRIQAKRNKARSRKQRLQDDEKYKEGSREEKLTKTAQKKVSFL